MRRYIQLGQRKGPPWLTAVRFLQRIYAKGAYIRPAVFTRAINEMRISQEEIFGPVLNVIPSPMKTK